MSYVYTVPEYVSGSRGIRMHQVGVSLGDALSTPTAKILIGVGIGLALGYMVGVFIRPGRGSNLTTALGMVGGLLFASAIVTREREAGA